ncbi:MAG TPA: dihydrofolate reductase family protein [Ignavibacteria bacterium]|nr:dihydrofolate reductase family protein [Ignavibacteria bacterium]HMR41236.1 dihydrofolate reductase family protein [Ignavibacteria bacterium]
MRKLIAAINMTLDGYCDHTAGIADEELHDHYTEMLRNADTVLYGRKTYQLMEFWKTVLKNPTGNKSMDDFAVAIDNIPKIVFSKTLKKIDWETAKLEKRNIKEVVSELRQQSGKDFYAGSPGLIASLTQLGLIDEYQICIHPVILGTGLTLFKNIKDKTDLKLLKTKTLGSGAIILYYKAVNKKVHN